MRRSLLWLVLALLWASSARADGVDGGSPADGGYSNGGGYSLTPPTSSLSSTTVLAAFPTSLTSMVDGYPLASRLLAATGRTVYLLQTFGESNWLPVAVLAPSDPAMDPAFLVLTPDGEKIALGVGLSKPLYIFPTSLISVANPVVLTTSPGAQNYTLNYYSAVFRDDRYLFVNQGGAMLGESDVFAINTTAAVTSPVIPIINNIPGASSGIAFDSMGDLITGIGWDADDSRTGELRIFPAAEIDAALGGNGGLDYDTDGLLLATGMLSADSLGFDSEGNLFVGGGDVFGTSGNYGYADLINAAVIARVLAGGPPADASNPADVTQIDPDPCLNQDWTGVTFVPGVDMLLVSGNTETPPNCETVDWTTGGTSLPDTVYFPPGAPVDSDGLPEGVDPNFEPQETLGPTQLSELVNALDATTADSNFNASVDYDNNGVINNADFDFLQTHWGMPPPPY